MLCSIIMLTWNQLDYTKDCLQTLDEYTDYPFELILVDNGSTDGTVQFLKSLKLDNQNLKSYKLITNNENRGVAKGWNQGLKEAQGEYLCILNNDILLTPQWLSKLIMHLDENQHVGAVSAHIIEGELKEEFQIYAKDYIVKNSDKISHTAILLTCCVIRREAFIDVGYFDEQFEMACYEDADYMWRMTAKKYQLDVIHSVVIYHYGCVSRKHLPSEYEKENYEKFKKKYAK